MLEILDSIIATGAVVLGLSLIVQAIQQIIKQSFDLKSDYMRDELAALFADCTGKTTLWSRLRRSKSIPPGTDEFARKLVNELDAFTRGLGFNDLHLLENITTEKFVDIMKSLPVAEDRSAHDQFKKAVEDAERWFEIAKRAFQEHYESKMKYWALGLSAALVLILNANLIDVYRDFSHNRVLRDAAVMMGERFTSVPRDSLLVESSEARGDTLLAVTRPDSQIVKEISAAVGNIQKVLDEESFQIMGWTSSRLARYEGMDWYEAAAEMVCGWLAMALLVSLGAPFWYDFLKAIMGVKKLVGGKAEKT